MRQPIDAIGAVPLPGAHSGTAAIAERHV